MRFSDTCVPTTWALLPYSRQSLNNEERSESLLWHLQCQFMERVLTNARHAGKFSHSFGRQASCWSVDGKSNVLGARFPFLLRLPRKTSRFFQPQSMQSP